MKEHVWYDPFLNRIFVMGLSLESFYGSELYKIECYLYGHDKCIYLGEL